jgi:hypothetical protein
LERREATSHHKHGKEIEKAERDVVFKIPIDEGNEGNEDASAEEDSGARTLEESERE